MRGKSGKHEAAADMLGVLAERLAAEQINAGLLDALKRKLEDRPGSEIPRETIDAFLQQELAHIRLLEHSIRRLGGSPSSATPESRVLGAANLGFQRVVQSSVSGVRESLDALLLAEVSDRMGWEKLVELAESFGQSAMAWEFRGALLEERDQETEISRWCDQLRTAEERAA